MKKVLLFLFFIPLCGAYSRITLPPVIGDNMLLQQQSKVKLWGKSDRKSEIKVTTGWDAMNYSTVTDKHGNWLVVVTTPVAGGDYSIVITDGDELVINNVLIGDVWYCSGQSNMEMPLKGMTASQPVIGANDAIAAAAKMKKMRVFTVAFGAEGEGVDKPYSGKWEIVNSETAADFSAIGYFFGRNLSDMLDIPIGMICSAKGGTRIEQWSDMVDLDTFSPHELNSNVIGNSGLYLQLVKPITQYAIKGFLWYQGESNWESNPGSYGAIFEKMIARWRIEWGQGELPFYFVEVAPMRHLASVELREGQYRVARSVPSVAMASTIDVGEPECIHPGQKEVVAGRLSCIALSKTYGMSGIRADNPSFKECWINQDGKIWIEFNHAEYGFFPRNDIDGFELAGSTGIFKPVKADAVYIRELDKNFIQIDGNEVDAPSQVRYCYQPWVKGTLYNTFNLPVLSFCSKLPVSDISEN
jgi:sialate O-acetylesterase